MEIHQLRYLVAVADELSFTRAAARLHVSQSGVSAQVQQLERELGLELFDRAGRRVRLTGAGEVVVPRARAALSAIQHVKHGADEVLGLVRGRVRVGAVTGLTWPPCFDAIAAVHDVHPGLEVELVEGTSSALAESVREGRLDAAVVAWSGALQGQLGRHVVVEEELVAVVAPSHPLAGRRSLDAAALAEHDVIALAPGTGARSGLERFLAEAGVRVVPRWEVANPVSVRLLVERGLGVGILSSSTVDAPDDLVRIRLAGPAILSNLGLVWRERPQPSVAAYAVIDAVRSRDVEDRDGSTG